MRPPTVRGEAGISSVELLLFLVVFLGVASAFGGVVLTTGLNSSDRAQWALNDALAQSDAGLELRGPVVALTDGARVTAIAFDVGLSSSQAVVPLIPEPAGERIAVAYLDDDNFERLLPYRVSWLAGDGDGLLEPGEMAELRIDVSSLDPPLAGAGSFHLEVRPPRGARLVVRSTLPPGAALDDALTLNWSFRSGIGPVNRD